MDTVFVASFVIEEVPDIRVTGQWVEFVSASGDGMVKRYMTRHAALGMVEVLARVLAGAGPDADNVVPIRGGHSQPL